MNKFKKIEDICRVVRSNNSSLSCIGYVDLRLKAKEEISVRLSELSNYVDANNKSVDVYIFDFLYRTNLFSGRFNFFRFNMLARALLLYKVLNNYKIVVVRYTNFDPILLILILLHSSKVFSEHHMKEVPDLRARKGLFYSYLEMLMGPLYLSVFYGHIGVTSEILESIKTRRLFGNPVGFVVPNCIKVSESLTGNLGPNADGVFNVLWVAARFDSRYGLEKIIEEIQVNIDAPVVFHIVGDISQRQKEILANSTKFIWYGVLGMNELNNIYKIAHMGLTLFNQKSVDLTEMCPLKTREYLSNGIPIYSAYYDSGLPKDFYFQSVCREFSISSLLDALESNKNFSKSIVQSMARPYIDISRKANSFIELESRNS